MVRKRTRIINYSFGESSDESNDENQQENQQESEVHGNANESSSKKSYDVDYIFGKIVRKRGPNKGKVFYRVKWSDYPKSKSSWIKAENIDVGLIEDYEKEKKFKKDAATAWTSKRYIVINTSNMNNKRKLY